MVVAVSPAADWRPALLGREVSKSNPAKPSIYWGASGTFAMLSPPAFTHLCVSSRYESARSCTIGWCFTSSERWTLAAFFHICVPFSTLAQSSQVLVPPAVLGGGANPSLAPFLGGASASVGVELRALLWGGRSLWLWTVENKPGPD